MFPDVFLWQKWLTHSERTISLGSSFAEILPARKNRISVRFSAAYTGVADNVFANSAFVTTDETLGANDDKGWQITPYALAVFDFATHGPMVGFRWRGRRANLLGSLELTIFELILNDR